MRRAGDTTPDPITAQFYGRGEGGPPLEERDKLLRGAKRVALDKLRGHGGDPMTIAEVRDYIVAGLLGAGMATSEAIAAADSIADAIDRGDDGAGEANGHTHSADWGEPLREAGEQLVVVDAMDFLRMPIPPRKLLLDPWLPEQGIAMIHAYRGTGKTHAGLGCAAAIATGGTFFRWRAREPAPTLYIDGEMPREDVQARLRGILRGGPTPAPGFLRLVTPDLQGGPMPNLATVGGQATVEPYLENTKVVFVDNISCLANGGPENDSDSWLSTQQWALSLRRRGIAVVFIHHSGKGGAQRGTSKREDVLDTVIGLHRPKDYRADQGARFDVVFEKTRGFAGKDAEPFEAALGFDEHGSPMWTMRAVDARADDAAVLRMADEGISQREIADAVGVSAATVNRILRKNR